MTRELTPMKWMNMKRFAALGLALLWSTGAAQAVVTNAIWSAKFTGSLGIQEFRPDTLPRLSVAKLNKGAFAGFVLNGAPSPAEQLALNIDMAQGQTNFYLTIFNTENRQNQRRITANEKTTLISDGKNLIFSLDAALIPYDPQWGGGFIRISGRGRLINGVPGSLRGAATGVFVDNRPGDLQGTTGLVIRAKMSTSGAPFRIQPPN